jgi:hypothetical protein
MNRVGKFCFSCVCLCGVTVKIRLSADADDESPARLQRDNGISILNPRQHGTNEQNDASIHLNSDRLFLQQTLMCET